ncbi:MAG: hypothetical protein IJ542_03610 [Clostridia bacterium]|nr:hypothetical protein [Clostridia bacterium]
MTKRKYPLAIFAIISLAIVAVSAIIVAIFGINSSVEISGGSQIEITMSYEQDGVHYDGKQNTQNYVSEINKVLANHSASIDTYVVEDKLVDTYLIVRIAQKEIKNADSIKTEIATALSIDEARVSNVENLASYFSNRLILYIGLALLAVIAICFFTAWLRYGILAGVSMIFMVLHNFIISLALVFLTRIQFSMITLCTVVALTILSTFAFASILERNRENSKSSQYAELDSNEKMMLATKQNKWLLVFAIAVLAISLVFVFTPIKYVRLAGVTSLIALAVAAYSVVLMVPAIHGYLLEMAGTREKKKLSKNVEMKPEKTKTVSRKKKAEEPKEEPAKAEKIKSKTPSKTSKQRTAKTKK